MEVKYMEEENYKDLESCLSDEEKRQIEGRNIFEKIWIKMKMKKQAKQMEVFDSMIENIENNDVSDLIPDEYKNDIKRDD